MIKKVCYVQSSKRKLKNKNYRNGKNKLLSLSFWNNHGPTHSLKTSKQPQYCYRLCVSKRPPGSARSHIKTQECIKMNLMLTRQDPFCIIKMAVFVKTVAIVKPHFSVLLQGQRRITLIFISISWIGPTWKVERVILPQFEFIWTLLSGSAF